MRCVRREEAAQNGHEGTTEGTSEAHHPMLGSASPMLRKLAPIAGLNRSARCGLRCRLRAGERAERRPRAAGRDRRRHAPDAFGDRRSPGRSAREQRSASRARSLVEEEGRLPKFAFTAKHRSRDRAARSGPASRATSTLDGTLVRGAGPAHGPDRGRLRSRRTRRQALGARRLALAAPTRATKAWPTSAARRRSRSPARPTTSRCWPTSSGCSTQVKSFQCSATGCRRTSARRPRRRSARSTSPCSPASPTGSCGGSSSTGPGRARRPHAHARGRGSGHRGAEGRSPVQRAHEAPLSSRKLPQR